MRAGRRLEDGLSASNFEIVETKRQASRPLTLLVKDEAVVNPQPRCPVCLLLDCSTSMNGAPIALLEEAVGMFYAELANDPIASLSVELAVVTFGDKVRLVRGFGPLERAAERGAVWLRAGGNTPMGGAIDLGLNKIGERRAYYKQRGMAAYRPWMVLMTDGQPNDDWQGPAARARAQAEAKRMLFVGVGIGDNTDWETLSVIVPAEVPPLRLAGLRFREFFQWLTDSLRLSVSASTAQKTALADPDDYGFTDWRV